MTSQCWRTAKSCHVTDTPSSSGSKSTCQAWYRCEAAGDYVIRWRCSKDDLGNSTTTTGAPPQLCTEQQVKQLSGDLADCPPPVVCANDPYEEELHITNDLSGDLILAIALASFAVLAIMLITASTYKYCKIRKRKQRRPQQPRHLFVRDYPYPVRYHHLWGASPHMYDVFNKKTTSSPVFSGPFPDVYFSKPCESSRKFEHLLSSSDDSLEDFPVSKFRHGGPSHHNGGKHKTDPSVVTGSFVFHQPGGSVVGGGGQSAKDRPDSRQYPAKKEGKENGSEESSECYHIYRGNLSRLHHHHHHQEHARFIQQQKRHHGKSDLPDMSAEFVPFPRLSSISIPSYGQHQGKSKRSDKAGQDHQLREERTERLPRNSFDTSCSEDSHASISPYATGHLDDSHKGRGGDHKKSHRGSPHSNSPDVISGHNFTNAFVRVGMNVYKSLQTRVNSEGSLAGSDFHDFESQKKVSGKHFKNHHGYSNNHNNNNNNSELSYDSFRNEHLKALATRGAASSSTLEAGFKHKSHDVNTPTHSRY
ncbi:hypothetical protein Btru_061417 [Bulinus truncatus]|nr:hypothetical protein Btru_061417 [Bulinus truncatus]